MRYRGAIQLYVTVHPFTVFTSRACRALALAEFAAFEFWQREDVCGESPRGTMRKLKFHEHKLLKKVDFLQWKNEHNLREVQALRQYHITDRDDYKK